MHAMTDAAVALFSEEGYSAVSTRRIAERAGCSETLLFRYFGDKHGLLMAVCNGLWDEGRPERSGAADFQTVQEYLEYFFLREISDLKHVAPSLKVVIAALINDPEMSADFNQKHDAAAERVAKELRLFQDTGAISPDVDVSALADGIEQLGFAVGFFLQLIFQRSEAELTAIAVSTAAALAKGLQANAGPAAARAPSPQGAGRRPRRPGEPRRHRRAAGGRRVGGRHPPAQRVQGIGSLRGVAACGEARATPTRDS